MQLYDVEPSQALSTVLGGYVICCHCEFVACSGASVPWICTRCGGENTLSRAYFPASVVSLLDLIQQQRWLELSIGDYPAWGERHAEIATVVYFCVFQETLLRHLLKRIMTSQELSPERQLALLEVNRGRRNRCKLFNRLTKSLFTDAIAEADGEASWALADRVADARNEFLHSGRAWDGSLAAACVNELARMLKLFAYLHNRWVARAALAPGGSNSPTSREDLAIQSEK